MKHTKTHFLLALLALVSCGITQNAFGWAAAGMRGTAAGFGGSGMASGYRGGQAAWSHGTGEATTARGGEATWSHGSGQVSTANGRDAAWSHGEGVATGPNGAAAWNHNTAYYGGYHPPGAYYPRPYPVPVYGGGYSSGQVAGAAVAGMAVGAMAGAAVASSKSSQQPTTVVVEQTGSPAYPANMPIGTQVSSLPGNCQNASISGAEYYICGNNWFKPYFGNSTVYYQVVPAP